MVIKKKQLILNSLIHLNQHNLFIKKTENEVCYFFYN